MVALQTPLSEKQEIAVASKRATGFRLVSAAEIEQDKASKAHRFAGSVMEPSEICMVHEKTREGVIIDANGKTSLEFVCLSPLPAPEPTPCG